jgi:hypothetical protein
MERNPVVVLPGLDDGSGRMVSLLEEAELAPGLEHRHRDGV